jgi:uncharacterized protein DUF4430
MRRRAALGLLGMLAAASLVACGAGPGAPPTDARLLVTADFGRTVVVDEEHPEIRGADTVMRLLQRNAKVTTRFGGGFVQSVDGLAGGQRGGRPVDWFFYVDGVLAETGAADVRVRDGTAIWWDHHDWGSGPGSGSAVVGSFPAPFARAASTGLACVPAGTAACAAARAALTRAGAHVAPVTPATAGRGKLPVVLVGAYAAIRSVPAARLLGRGPTASGVYARPSQDGARLTLLDARGRRVRDLGAGAGLVAATRSAGNPPVWSVTGTDDAGVLAAARTLDAERLHRRFAVAVDAGEPIALPQEPAR